MLAQESISWAGAWALMLVVGAILVGSGFLVVSIARRAADGRLGPNGIAGIRTRTTRSSPEAWEAAHQVALAPTVRAGWAMIVSAIVAPIVGYLAGQPDDPDRAVIAWSTTILVGSALLIGFVVYGAIKGQAAAKAVLEASV